MGELKDEDVPQVVDKWGDTEDFIEEGVYHRVQHVLKHHPTVAIRDTVGNLVAFEMTSQYGAMSMLHVEPDHRRKGLATTVELQLCKKLYSKGMVVYCHVHVANKESPNLHKKCGFVIEEEADTRWILYRPKPLADPGGCRRRVPQPPPPRRINFFHFCMFSLKTVRVRGWCPRHNGSVPPPTGNPGSATENIYGPRHWWIQIQIHKYHHFHAVLDQRVVYASPLPHIWLTLHTTPSHLENSGSATAWAVTMLNKPNKPNSFSLTYCKTRKQMTVKFK